MEKHYPRAVPNLTSTDPGHKTEQMTAASRIIDNQSKMDWEESPIEDPVSEGESLSVQMTLTEELKKINVEQTMVVVEALEKQTSKLGKIIKTAINAEKKAKTTESNENDENDKHRAEPITDGSSFMSNAEDLHKKGLEYALKGSEAYAKAAETNTGQMRVILSVGIAVISLLIGGLYFSVNSGNSSLRNEMQANTKAIQAEMSSIRNDIKSMNENLRDHQAMYERVIDERTKK